MLHITESAWRAIGEPQYVRIAVNVKSQKIKLTAQEGRDKQAKKIVLRQGGHGYKIGTVKRFIDVGMRTGRYFYEGNNVFRHE